MCGILLQIVYFIVTLCLVKCAKYDIQAESQKLYGEDLNGALRNFRKTYDYVQILEEKRRIIEEDIMDSYAYLEEQYARKLERKIRELLGIKEKENATRVRTIMDRKRIGRQDTEEDEAKGKAEQEAVILLDDHIAGKRVVLTVPEINSLVNLGFEFTGKIIHGMISHLGGSPSNDQPGQSTKQGGNDQDYATTKHDHSVTNEGTFVTTTKSEDAEEEDNKVSYRARTVEEARH